MVLGQVDGDIEGHARESLLECLLQITPLVLLITSMPKCDGATLLESDLVDLVHAASLILGSRLEAEGLVVGGSLRGQEGEREEDLVEHCCG